MPKSKKPPLNAKPAADTKCQEASTLSRDAYIPCGRPAAFIINNGDKYQYAMCSGCANHNVKNRGARYVTDDETYTLATIPQPTAKEIASNLSGPLAHNTKNSLPDQELDEDVEEAPEPTNEQLTQIVEIARAQWVLIEEMAELNRQLEEKQKELSTNQDVTLPAALNACGLGGLPLKGGYAVELKKNVRASIPASNPGPGIAYMEENAPDLVKHQFTFKFDRGQESIVKKFMADLKKRKVPLEYEVKDTVNANTLAAYVKQQDKAGKSVPEDILGVYRSQKAIVVPPKADKNAV